MLPKIHLWFQSVIILLLFWWLSTIVNIYLTPSRADFWFLARLILGPLWLVNLLLSLFYIGNKDYGIFRFIPSTIFLFICIVSTVNVSDTHLINRTFYHHEADYNAIVELVQDGVIHQTLPSQYDHFSLNGGVIIDELIDLQTIFFLDVDATSDNIRSGYLYISDRENEGWQEICSDWEELYPRSTHWIYCQRYNLFP